MPQTNLRLIAAALLLLASCLARSPARAANGVSSTEPSDAAVRALGRGGRDLLRAFEQNDYSVRELTYYAHYVLAMGQEPAKAEAAIHLAFLVQDMDPNSADYGTFPWDIQGFNHLDPNSVEFTLESLGPILLRHGDKLSDRIKREAADHVRAGLAAVRRHKVPVTYTNMFLMKTENLLLLGEWSGDQQAVTEAGAMLDQWLTQCRTYGIHEFASPTYTGVQLNSLGNAGEVQVYWDEYFHGEQSSLIGYAGDPPLKFGLLQTLLVFLALIFTFSRRNGPIHPLPQPSRL